jgi:hypothetical protein
MNVDLYDLLKFILLPVILFYIGFNERDKLNMKLKLEKTSVKEEVEKLIDLKMNVHQVQIQDIKDDLHRIETKLDVVLEKLK